jgi:hypothetical protein
LSVHILLHSSLSLTFHSSYKLIFFT